MKIKKIPPLHPGEVLYDDFLQPLKISQNQIARDLGVSPRRINEIIHGKRSVTADTALRFSLYFGNSAQFWMGLQMDYDLDKAEDCSLEKLKGEVSRLLFDSGSMLAEEGKTAIA
jgi:addiction module HigA family antidote